MNHYGIRAKEYWQANAPRRYAALEDPEESFGDIGIQFAAQVEGITKQLEAKLLADLGYLERVGQLRAIQLQAEAVGERRAQVGEVALRSEDTPTPGPTQKVDERRAASRLGNRRSATAPPSPPPDLRRR